ncbi:myelin regulatory factor-like protein isoform X1 [Takifugu flavidus]|uniref:myelin regulatory factor-like protein isoform X1 n=1 Tax=Takifugu flavidus TaxID=433684 RepID=UPI002544CF5D|nr:myelin regulatory factor-like protein isoform X1 [Takifugu flavidus]XP_056878524.1 myelin regulatory factor-like protein isoform X1 [Takifugu flavidus]
MEPGGGRPAVQVVGENEALQQFFCGQDVSGVLDNSVTVDTSILEQYLSNDLDPNSFMLPESPPDSEACSPAQIPDFPCESSYWSSQRTPQEVFQPRPGAEPPSSCRFKGPDSSSVPPELLTYDQLRSFGLTNTYIRSGTSPAGPSPLQQRHPHEHYQRANNLRSSQAPPTPASPPTLLSNTYDTPSTSSGLVPHVTTPPSTCALDSSSVLTPCSTGSKRRRRSVSEETSAGVEAPCAEGDGNHQGSFGNVGGVGSSLGLNQHLTWDHFKPDRWCTLFSSSFQTLSPPAYHVDTDKGFVYSTTDEAFVCQKKNHFQVTVHIGVATEPRYIRSPRGPQEVDHFLIKVFGIKMESSSRQVTIEQSQPDRSKKPFHPVRVSLPSGKITKVTLGRLHFSETTANNMRKKGKPNPDQRYFQMVVGLYGAVSGEESLLLTALVSERIIVRASNPGQFEMDGDPLWQRGVVQESVVCQGRVGINSDAPDEALVVCGNAKVMGAIMQPSDQRAKYNIQEVDSEQQLKRINQMRIVEFDYKPEFASSMGIDHTHQTGVLAQEVKELLPSAVTQMGDICCSDGEKIQNFLMVDKEQIFMENVGAVQHLSKLTDNLETRITDLEVWNQRLAKLKSLSGSLRSNSRRTMKHSGGPPTPSPDTCKTENVQKETSCQRFTFCLRHKIFQASIFALLAAMAFCVICITAVYLVNLTEEDFGSALSNSSETPPQTTACSSTANTAGPTGQPEPWPPDVDFCDLLYCDQVYCCSPPAGGSVEPQVPEPFEKSNVTGLRKQAFYRHLKRGYDWTNTSIQSFMIKENQQLIDRNYCVRDECGPERFAYRVPISQFVPVNMKVTLVMNSTELLVVHLCRFDESAVCSSRLNAVARSRYPSNTQGEHQWPLHASRLYQSSYHFRSAVAGQADCSTDHNLAGVLFTDYYFHFYRRCTDPPTPL